MKRLLWLVGIAVTLVAAAPQQEAMPPPLGPQAILRHLTMTAYPEVEAWLALQGPEGYFIGGVTADDIRITEEGQPRAVEALDIRRPGMLMVFAINPARSFAVRDAQGVSRFDYIYYQFQTWLQRAPAQHYDMSLVTRTGVSLRHTDDPGTLLDAIEAFREEATPNFRQMEPDLAVLTRALALAMEPTALGQVAREVLFITAPITLEQADQLPGLARQAREAGVRVSVWLVGHRDWAEMPQTDALVGLARATGGHFVLFSGQEVLPDLHEFFTNREQVYRLVYRTARTQPGPVTVTIEAPTAYGVLTAQGTYDITLEPPAVQWRQVPQTIVRIPPRPDAPRSEWRPTEQRLTIAIDFPDGTPRDIVRTTLYVDGEAVQTQTQPPFERFLWDLRAYTDDGTHQIQVEAEDALGLTGRTPPVTVSVRLVAPTPIALPGQPTRTTGTATPDATAGTTPAPASRPEAWSAVTWAVGLAGLALLGALGWGLWRYRPAVPGGDWLARLRTRVPWGRPRETDEVAPVWAVLEPLPPLQPGWPTGPRIVLRSAELILGADPAVANVILADPSVSPRHARLWRDARGRVFLADLQSVAGTWVNYTPITTQGLALEEDDIVYIGRFGFRVHLGPPEAPPSAPPVQAKDAA